MEKRRKEIVGEEEEKFDLTKEDDIDKMIEQLEAEKKALPPTPPPQPEVKAPTPKHKPVEAKTEAKPVWAKTEKQLKDEKDDEAEELIEFAYELDYEKYVEDMEV